MQRPNWCDIGFNNKMDPRRDPGSNSKTQGYPNAAAFLHSDESFIVYRRFGYLQSRVLLQTQDELRKLEEKLMELDSNDDYFCSSAEHHWSMHSRETTPSPDTERACLRDSLLERMNAKLREYDEILDTERRMMSIGGASTGYRKTNFRTTNAGKRWINAAKWTAFGLSLCQMVGSATALPIDTKARASEEDLLNGRLLWGIGGIACLSLIAALTLPRRVLGNRLSDVTENLPAPAMTVFSGGFVMLRNGDKLEAKVAWVFLTLWTVAVSAYIKAQYDRITQKTLYLLSSAMLTGVLIGLFATVQQSSLTGGIVTVIPPVGAFAVFACAALLRGRFGCLISGN